MKLTAQRKKAVYDRMIRSGNWAESRIWKESVRTGPPKLTGDEAWTRMEQKFLPKEFLDELDLADAMAEDSDEYPAEPPIPPSPELTEEEVQHLIKVSGGEVDMRADLEWAYSHHLYADLSATDAPTAGAWNLIEFAKANRTKFMELAIKLLSTKKTTDAEDRWGDNCPEVLDLVDKLLASCGKPQQ